VLAALHRRGDLSLAQVETVTWRFDGEFERTRALDVEIQLGVSGASYAPVDAREHVFNALLAGSLRAVAFNLQESPELHAAFAEYASRLAGAPLDPVTLTALTNALPPPSTRLQA
jgi:hypothetical protein